MAQEKYNPKTDASWNNFIMQIAMMHLKLNLINVLNEFTNPNNGGLFIPEHYFKTDFINENQSDLVVEITFEQLPICFN